MGSHEKTLQLDIPLLLPEVKNERDQCIERLKERLSNQRGVYKVHIERGDENPLLCLHYDPNLFTLAQVSRLAHRAGAEISKQFHHESLHVTGMDCADCALSIEHILQRQPGVITVAVNYAAEKMRIEYNSNEMDRETIRRLIRRMGYDIDEEKTRN